MYGVPADLPVNVFVGKELNQIGLGRFQIQFHCSGTGSIFVEGRWELRDSVGELVDRSTEHDRRQSYRVHSIIDVPIVGSEIDPPRSFTLAFESGHRLTVFDDTPQYSSFSVHLDGEPSLYV
jgi:hypothetical protein